MWVCLANAGSPGRGTVQVWGEKVLREGGTHGEALSFMEGKGEMTAKLMC